MSSSPSLGITRHVSEGRGARATERLPAPLGADAGAAVLTPRRAERRVDMKLFEGLPRAQPNGFRSFQGYE